MSMSTPKFGLGLRVRALGDLHNDGSFPDVADQALLVGAEAVGEIVKIGTHVDSNAIVYLVDFNDRVVGCFENEIAPQQV